MPNMINSLRAKLEEEERKKKLAGQSIAYEYQTTGPTGPNFTLQSLRDNIIPYTVDTSDYLSYRKNVKDYTQKLKQGADAVTPENVKEYENLLKTQGAALGRTGTGLRMFAGGTGLSKKPIIQAMQEQLQADAEAQGLISTVKKYPTTMDYNLGEKTKTYEDFKQRMEEGGGDLEALRKAILWGNDKVEVGGNKKIADTTLAAAQAAPDEMLPKLRDEAHKDSQKGIFQQEIQNREAAKLQGLYDLLNDNDKAELDSAKKNGYTPTVDVIRERLQGEMDEITMLTEYGNFDKDTLYSMLGRKQAIEAGLWEYDNWEAQRLQGYSDENEALSAYNEMREGNADLNLTDRYKADKEKQAADWGAALKGNYTGQDAQILDFTERRNKLEEELRAAIEEEERLVYLSQNSSEADRTAATQRVEELLAQMDALEAEAKGEQQSAQESLDSMREALHGKGSVGRLGGSLVKQVVTGWDKAIVGAAGIVAKPFEAIGRTGVNLAEMGYAAITGDIENVQKEWEEIKQTPGYVMQKGTVAGLEKQYNEIAAKAEEEAYHARKAITDSEVLDTAYEIADQILMMAPDMAIGYMTGGASTAATMQNAMTEYIASLGKGQMERLALSMANNPGFYTSLIREWSADIEDAREKGVPVGAAEALGTLTALVNAAIEVGGGNAGIQDIGNPNADDGAATALFEKVTGHAPGKAAGRVLGALDTSIAEGTEEITQGLMSGANQQVGRIIAGHPMKTISYTPGEEAMINVPDLGREGLMGAVVGGLMDVGAMPINAAREQRAENTAIGQQVLANDWGQALGQQAQAEGITNRTAQKLEAGTINPEKKKAQRKTGALYKKWVKVLDAETEAGQEALQAARAMVTYSKGQIVKNGKDAQDAIDTGEKLAQTAQISEDGENRLAPKEGEETGEAVEIVGVGVKGGKINIRIKKDGELSYVPYEDVRFADPETAEKAAMAALVGGDEAGSAILNAHEPGSATSFKDYAKQFVTVYNAAKNGIELGAVKASGIVDSLTDTETKTAWQLGSQSKQMGDLMEDAKRRATEYAKSMLRAQIAEKDAGNFDLDDVDDLAEAIVAREAGEEITEEQAEKIAQYEDSLDLDDVTEALNDEAPVFGAQEAYQIGLSGRRIEEVESTLNDLGRAMTDEIRQAYEQGAADLALKETNRMNEVKRMNKGADGSRVGVLRGISQAEADAAGVRTIQGPYNKHMRDAITALRGFAETTGVNMVLFESPVKEGEHTGANGWYDSKTQTVYLDVYSGKGNEQAIMRTASHELTHFIQDWSPANYKKYRDFLLDHYYGSDNNAVKRLVQEQIDKDGTLTESEAMDEVVADASEMMLDGDEDATKAMAEQHPSLFVRIRGWIDTWAKALSRAVKSLSPSNMASRMLRENAGKFAQAQKMWWQALEDASANLRGEIRQAEIDADTAAKLHEVRQRKADAKKALEESRQEAIERANEAQTVEEGEQAVQEAQEAQALIAAQETQAREEERQIQEEAEEQIEEARKLNRAGRKIEKNMGMFSQDAKDYIKQYAATMGIALDGTARTGSALIKEAKHYYNQGLKGIAFKANTAAGKTNLYEMAERMNHLGQEARENAQLKQLADAEEETQEQESELSSSYEIVPWEMSKEAIAREYNIEDWDSLSPDSKENLLLLYDERVYNLGGQHIHDSLEQDFIKLYKEISEERARLEQENQTQEQPRRNQEPVERVAGDDMLRETEKRTVTAEEAEQREQEQPRRNQEPVERVAGDDMLRETEKRTVTAEEAEQREQEQPRRNQEPVERVAGDDMLRETAKETENAEQAQEVVRNGFDDDRLLNNNAISGMGKNALNMIDRIFSGKPLKIAQTETRTEAQEEVQETEELTPEESSALETHAQTVQKMAEVMKGMTKRAQNLVMKWGANEHINVSMEDGSEKGIAFAQWAKKWYDAGRAGDSILTVQETEEEMTTYPPFLQTEFYNQGKADAAAAEKARQRREKKKNEKPADQGTAQPVGDTGDRTGRLLEEVPAQDVQEQGGGRDAVSEPAVPEQRDGGNDAGLDEPGSVRERGEGVRERDNVRSEAGEVAEEEAEETPEEKLQEAVEKDDAKLEAETPKGTNYQIGDSLNLPSGEKARYKANMDAVRMLRTLEAENRYATAEEQEILSKYVGWGGLSQAFDESNGKWKKEYAELAEMLTGDEYNAARASTTNAHYTSVEVIRAMYEGLRHLGFQGGRMLEPSGGIGHFIGAMPADMQQKVRSWTMVELDSITGRIAAKLYPNADVRVQGFETAKIGNNVMDVAIGNVPFGNFPIVDSAYPREVTSAIHNYFFAKAIDKVRPGGLLMFITSRYTMDAQNSSIRTYMMERADLLGAVRLPYTAFKGNAGTEVVTDILIFKKREAGTPYRGVKFDYSAYTNIGGDYVNMNEYFVAHPEMVLGTLKTTGTMYRNKDLNVEPKGANLGQQITEAIGRIETKMDYGKNAPSVEELQKRAEKARANTKENGYEVKDGKIYQNQNGELKAVEMKEADAQKVKDMLAIRDTARALQELQKQGADKKAIADKRKELNRLYDAFVEKTTTRTKKGKVSQVGYLHASQNAKIMEADPDHYFLLSLENWDKKTKTATKADIFSKDTIAAVVTVDHADTPQDAIAVVLNEKGYIDLARAAELLGVTEDEAKAAMIDNGLAFLTDKGTLETRENYLSGDVRAKLRQAEALATVDERYQRNVDELKKVIPEDVTRENIYVKPGATWIPESVYEQFICETLKEYNTRWDRNVTVTYDPTSGEYTLELSNRAKRDFRNKQEWGTQDRTFEELFYALMNNKTITVNHNKQFDEAATLAAREKAEKIQKRFTEWLWENEDRAKALEKIYNDRYNAIVVPEYDGSGLTIAGANANKQLRPHQKNVVHRIIQNGGNTLIAHCVGAGKTAEMAGAAMKLRQLGIVQKPVFVVPKALVGQWGREFLDFFPAAKILVLGENDFNEKNRKEFSNKIATGDYDAIIMSREQFSYIPMSEEYEENFYKETIAQIQAAIDEEKKKGNGKKKSVKEQEKSKARLEGKLKELVEKRKKDKYNINFEDMGIDSVFVDEAHEYKNLMYISNMNNVSGLGSRKGSQRAFDMYMKTKYLRSVNGGRGIVFATATPVMNSMSEMYTMQRYLQEDKLNQLGIHSFDAWANLFGEVIKVVEPNPSGKGLRIKEAFARFKNLPELQRLFRSFADVKTKVEGLKVPKMKGGKRITIECEPGPFQLQYIDQLAERAEKMRGGHVDPKVDNMLKITSEGRKLSYTQRMIDPSLPYEEGSKILKCVENVEKIYQESKGNKGTQLIFCDMAVPKGQAETETDSDQETEEDADNVNFYGDIKRMLVAKGIPTEEIAFIHDANSNAKRVKLFEDVNEGRVRVLIGSTGKMGVGMNAQKRIVALHHLDAPWRPGDIEQREGRALRQGNINDEVGIYVYVTKRTFDTRMWDNLYRKANFINQIMNGTNTAREVEGDGDFALSAAEIKAIATGDPMIVEQFEVNNQIKKLESLEREWLKDKKRARETIQMNNARIVTSETLLPKAEADMKTAAALDLENSFAMKIDGKRYTERAKANAPLLEAVKKHEGIVSEKKIGEIGGFTLYADGKGSIVIKGAGTYSVNVNFESDSGTMTRVINQIKGIKENADKMRAAIQQLQEENRSAEERMNQPFDKAEGLEQLRARAEEIANILNPVEDQAGAANLDEDTEGTEGTEEKKVKYSKRADSITTNGIETGMDDYERYEKLRGASIHIEDATGFLPEFELAQYNKMRKSDLEEALLPIARKYSLIPAGNIKGIAMQNKYLTVQADFSRRSLSESLHKQENGLANIAALLPVFQHTYENAIPVLMHGDRYELAVNDVPSLDSFVYLLGAFSYNGKTVPVQFELKHINDITNSIYIVATIKEDAILGTSTANGGNVPPASSTMSLSDVIKEVKPVDTRILANLPSPFLSEKQKAGKRQGLQEKGDYLRNKAQQKGRRVDAPITMTTERIDAEIRANGAKFTPDYSQAYMTFVNPSDFIALNTVNPESKQNESRVLVASELREERQTPFMTFDQETGQITGHEGRHRMAALAYAGVQQVAILMKPDGSEGRYNRSTIEELNVKGKHGSTATLYNLIPVNEKHRQELIDTYGESSNWFQYSERDPDNLSDRQLLARAYEGLAKTDTEKKALEKYKSMIVQLDTDTETLKNLKKQIHDKTFVKGQVDRVGALKLQEQADALAKKIAKTDKTLLNMQRSAALKNVLEVEKKEAQKKVREKIQGQLARYNEGVTKREYAERIKKTTERLAKWIVQPDKTNHVPKALKTSVARFLLSIQQGAGTQYKGKGGARRERNFIENMRALQGIVTDITSYQMMGADERVQADFGMYIDLPDGFSEQMAELIKSIESTMHDAGASFNVNEMTGEQMKTLYQVMSTISSSIGHANDLLAMNNFRHVDQAALNSIGFIRQQGKVDFWRGGSLHNFLNWENIQPVRAFERFGEGGNSIFWALAQGQAQMARNVVKILEYTDPEYAKETAGGGTTLVYSAAEAKEWSEQIRTFTVGDKQVSMPIADVMSLYCLMKRGHAVGHIFGEGFRVADFKDKRGKVIAGSGVTITQAEAQEIISTLTPRQIRVADKLQNIMSTQGSQWGNYVSMKRFGYEMFTEKNYFPIEVDSDRLMAKTDESKGNELYRLLNLSSVKPITPHASNRLMIKNIFEVFSDHMTDMAQYNALGLPILDAVKWINFTHTEQQGDRRVPVDSIRTAAREMYGNKAGRYIIELLKDLNGTQAMGDIGEKVGKNALMRFNRQAVAANLSVAMKQPTSIIRAAMELGGLDLLRGAVGNQGMYRQNVNEMLEYSGIALWKDLGFYDVNVSRPVKAMIMHSDTAVDRLLEKATWLAEKADKVTWAAIWGASKAWVQRNGGTFAKTDEFMQAVTRKFEEVIYKTQVVDSMLTRSQFMRGTSFISKWLSSFMSEPTTTYNMLLDTVFQIQNDMRKGMNAGQAYAKHFRTVMRTTAVYVASAAVMTLLEALIGAWRDDDDYETFMEKFKAGLLNNALDEFLPFNLLPVVNDIYDYGKKLLADYVFPDEWNVYSYAGGDSPIYSALDTFMSAAEVADKYFSGQMGYTLYAVIYKGINALSQVSGIPIAPAMREVVALWNNTVTPFAPEMRIETYESNETRGAEALYAAMVSGDAGREATVRKQLAANNADPKKVETALKSLIKDDLAKGNITEEQAENRLKVYAGMKGNDAWKQVQKWGYEAEHEDNYTEDKALENAIISGTGIQQAVNDLTAHGKTAKEVQSKVRSIISEQTGKEKKMTVSTAERLLKAYGGLDANAAWIRAQELRYQQMTGKETTSDIAMVKYAVEKRTSPKTAIDELMAHGKEKKDISTAVTNAYKDTYLDLRKSNPSQAATLKGQLISIYEYLGYDGKKKVEEWEKEKKK